MDRTDIVIVGGGLAGAAVAEEYRKAGGNGSVALISSDGDIPVHRPPLSKEYLRGEESLDNVFVHPASFYADNAVEMRTNASVERIQLADKRLTLAGGETAMYGTLVVATGASPRRLNVPGVELPGVYYLRSLKSSEQLREAYGEARQAVIIGAGFIGMEVAATLTQRGVTCTVVEMGPRMWPRLVPDGAAAFIQRYCEDRGITFRFGVGVTELWGTDHVRSVVLDTGETLPADLVIAGVGAALNTDLARDAGLAVDQGIVVDEYLQTSDPNVYAAGDVARFPDPIGGSIHLEHWDNALHQGRALGRTLAGEAAPFDHLAYFFSDLFDLSINMVGYPLDWDDTVMRGDPDDGSFTTLYFRGGSLRAALMVNDDQNMDTYSEEIKRDASRQRSTVNGLAG